MNTTRFTQQIMFFIISIVFSLLSYKAVETDQEVLGTGFILIAGLSAIELIKHPSQM